MTAVLALNEHDHDLDRVLSQSDPRWQKLYDIIGAKSLMTGDFTLASKRKSNFLFQLRQTTLHPEGAYLVGSIIIDFMRRQRIKCLGGLELGAVPIVSIVAGMSHMADYPVSAFFIRKKPKSHGAQELVDGYVLDGNEILAIDDVTTTGGSMMDAVNGLASEHDCTVKWALSIVDREEGAKETLSAHGIKLVSIFKKSDFKI